MANIEGLFSERAQSNSEFNRKVIQPTQDELNSIKALVDVFPELISVDYMPVKYLKLLGDTFGYPYLETEDPEVQREILKHLVDTYHQKGSQALFEKALAYSYDTNYALGDMTYYRKTIDPGDFNITFPRDIMFQYDNSLWNVHKISDRDTVALGIIDLAVERCNSRTETYLDQLIPAGIKYLITIEKDISDDPVVFPIIPDYDQWVLHEPPIVMPYSSSKDILIPANYYTDASLIDPEKVRQYDNSKWNGRTVVSHDQQLLTREAIAYFRVIKADDYMYKARDIINNPKYADWTPLMADKYRDGYEPPRGTDIPPEDYDPWQPL